MRKLSIGEELVLSADATTEFDGLRQAYDHLNEQQMAGRSDSQDDSWLEQWDEARPTAWRAMGDPRGGWARLWDWFRDRRYVRDIYVDREVQVPIFHVASVQGGSASATYSIERSGESGATIQIAGLGGGAGFARTMEESFEFDAAEPPQMSSMVSTVLVTAYLFDNGGRHEVVTDVRPKNAAFVHVVDDAPAALQDPPPELIADLRQAPVPGEGTYTFHSEKSYSWNVDLGIEADIGSAVKIGVSYAAEQMNGIEASFTLPNGVAYNKHAWPGSIVPRIA